MISGIVADLKLFYNDTYVALELIRLSAHNLVPSSDSSGSLDFFRRVLPAGLFASIRHKVYRCTLPMRPYTFHASRHVWVPFTLLLGMYNGINSVGHMLTFSCVSVTAFVWFGVPGSPSARLTRSSFRGSSTHLQVISVCLHYVSLAILQGFLVYEKPVRVDPNVR